MSLYNNLLRDTFRRQLDESWTIDYQRIHQVTPDLIRRLGLETELEGHGGCVNCLEWNSSGTLLASGSDDLQVIVWDPFGHKQLTSIRTSHNGNIFSVKFLPFTNDCMVVSAAADSKICVHDMTSKDTIQVYSCHSNRVKRLAIAPNLPNMFWSASEDGTIMQFDIRCPEEANSTYPHNVLINLKAHSGPGAEAKCLAINSLRPEQLAVGANDPYVRMYDRRMLTCKSIKFPGSIGHGAVGTLTSDCYSAEEYALPQDSAKYFVAAHLPQKQQDYKKRYRMLAATYVTFSPDGSELLVNLGGEQIYLFDVNGSHRPKIKLEIPIETLNGNGIISNKAAASVHTNGFTHTNGMSQHIPGLTSEHAAPITKPKRKKCENRPLSPVVQALKQQANTEFEKGKYTHAISYYNKAIAMAPDSAVLYGNRAASYMKRAWDGDVYAAMRDCHSAIKLDPNHLKAHFRLSRCLYELCWMEEADACLKVFKTKFPAYATSQTCETLDRDIKAAIFAKSEEAAGDTKKDTNKRPSLRRSLSKGNEQSDQEKLWRADAQDYKLRLCGHCNTTTDIKEANFFGSNGQYIIAGSDDGSFFIWDRKTTNIVRVLRGDDSIVNCLQPHPSSCLLATSGIDSVIRLWSPKPEDGQKDDREVDNSDDAASANQKRMNADPLEVMLMNMGYRISGAIDGEEEEEGNDSPVGGHTTQDRLHVGCRQS